MELGILAFHRWARRLAALGVPILPDAVLAVGSALHKSHLPLSVRVGRDVELGYGGLGIFVAPGVEIGDGTFICHEVTLGSAPESPGVPRIGRNVLIGAGAKVMGSVRIGDGATIGANALVLSDVPPGVTVAGIPARPTRSADAGSVVPFPSPAMAE